MLTLSHAPWLDFAVGQRLSIGEALRRAHIFGDLRGNSGLETFALYRFLASVLQSIYAPKTLDDIQKISERGFFQQNYIDAFCANHFMWMGDGQKPFAQVPDLDGDPKSIGYLTFDVPTGSDPVFFNHQAQDRDKAYCQRCVAYGLISLSSWQTIGGQGLTASINGTPPLYFLPKCDTLFETLVRCLVPTGAEAPGRGVWDRQIFNNEYQVVSYLHGLTFMPRRVKVLWQGSQRRCTRCGEVTNIWASEMFHKKGEKFIGKDWTDPFVAYRVNNKAEAYPALIRGEVSNLSNDYLPAVRRVVEKAERKPQIMQLWPEQKQWLVFGALTNQAKWFDTFKVQLDLDACPAEQNR